MNDPCPMLIYGINETISRRTIVLSLKGISLLESGVGEKKGDSAEACTPEINIIHNKKGQIQTSSKKSLI